MPIWLPAISAALMTLTTGGLPAQTGDGASRFAVLEHARIHYKSWGSGPEALVLIHGWSCSLDNWRDQIPEFSKRARVIALDLPGHGQSDKPERSYSMDYLAQGVAAVLRDAGVRRAVLVGHSMGTPVARQFWRKYPGKTLALVAVDGPLTRFFDRATMEGLLTALRSPAYQATGSAMLAALAGRGLTTELKDRVSASFLNTPQHVIISAMEGLADDAIWRADPVTVPVLAVLAKNRAYPPDIEQRTRAVAPKLELQLWDGVGHFLMMEQPRRFNAAVIAFLDRQRLLTR